MTSKPPVLPERTFRAICTDRDGFVHLDEDVRAWCADPDATEARLDFVPQIVAVVTNSAAAFYEAGVSWRVPGTHYHSDVWVETGIYGMEPDEVLVYWEQASLIADALEESGEAQVLVQRLALSRAH